MKPVFYLHPSIYINQTKEMGRGVFTAAPLAAGTVIEIAPVIVLPPKDRERIDATFLHDYIFEWGRTRKQSAVALGYVSLYNHSYTANCEYQMNFRQQAIAILTVRDIGADEELFINYNGEPNNTEPVWFHRLKAKETDLKKKK